MANICKVTLENIDELYNDYSGNLYYKPIGLPADAYEPAGEFNVEELKSAIAHHDIDVIFMTYAAVFAIARALECA